MFKHYNPEGEKGETRLFGGIKVMKDSPRVKAYGTVDEFNSVIGVARSHVSNIGVNNLLMEVQKHLFVVGSDLASQTGNKDYVPQVDEEMIEFLENHIEIYNEKIEPLKNFILPSGSTGGANLHMARTICRRAEREVVALASQESVNRKCILYLNRLSDLLFVLARYVNHMENQKEDVWKKES